MSKRTVQGVIRWEDPPPPGDNQAADPRPWALVAAELRADPGRWALISDDTGNVSLVSRIKAGNSWWKPAGAFEATTRTIGGRLHIWARYVGGVST